MRGIKYDLERAYTRALEAGCVQASRLAAANARAFAAEARAKLLGEYLSPVYSERVEAICNERAVDARGLYLPSVTKDPSEPMPTPLFPPPPPTNQTQNEKQSTNR